MLQEATKVIGSAFRDSFIKRLSMYLHDCVSEEIRSCAFKNLNQDKTNKWFFLEEQDFLTINPDKPLRINTNDSKLTELMVQSEASRKDYQLIYGFLFLKGRSRKKEEFLTPLLYVPCRLERDGFDIKCTLQDDYLSINTSALVSLMEFDEEDDTAEHLLDGIIDYIPDMPLSREKIDMFLNVLKVVISDDESLEITEESAVILTRRPAVLAGLLHELSEIAEKPAGVFRETALAPIHDEFTGVVKNKKTKVNEKHDNYEKTPVTPLPLSDVQKQVIEEIKNNTLVTVFGPPGTGKSQTIVNIASHLIGSGQTVLVASKMDKAVDVVSERLNSFGAKFLCLRAGKPDYQKQLSFQLQDLISNKIDLDSGFESSILTEIDDLKQVTANKEDIEGKTRMIFQLEQEWFSVFHEYEKIEKDGKLVNETLTGQDVTYCRKLLDKIENTYDKEGILNNIQQKAFTLLLKYKLKNDINLDTITRIRQDLDIIELKEKLKKIEIKISKNGNITQNLENLGELREKYSQTSRELLKDKRRTALKILVRDQYKRQRLIIHSKALVERKKNLQNRVLLGEDFTPLLEAFPCWAVTTQVASESLPLEPAMFDVVIIDESSQCDIAGCIPLLFRAKRAIIVGDDKQLPHLSFLEKAKEQSFLNKYNIPDKYQLMWRYRTNSMFDVAHYYSTSSVLLDEHFRSYPEIIEFSNREFYGGRLKIMKRQISANAACPIELNIIDNAKVDLDSTRNMAEVEKIIDKIHEIIQNDPKASIGVISPFRGQVELVKKALYQVFDSETIRRHQIEAGTAHTFQGDERDIMLLSLTVAPNSHYQSITFAQKPNLFNVAITRARKKLICYVSRPVESLPPGILRDYLEYIQAVNRKLTNVSPEDPIKAEIKELLENEGLTVLNDIEIGGHIVDFVVSHEDKTLLLETVGFESKEILTKHQTLERCGWKFAYISSREWSYSKKACINRIKGLL